MLHYYHSLVNQNTLISSKKIQKCKASGDLVIENIFTPKEIKKMLQALTKIANLAKNFNDSNSIFDLDPSHIPKNSRIRRIKNPFYNHPVFEKAARSPKLISVLTSLLGPNVRMHRSKIKLKAPHDGVPVE